VPRVIPPLSGLRSLPRTALRPFGLGLGLVVVVTLLFGGVGAWQARDLEPAAATPAPAPAPPPPPAPPAEPEDDEDVEGEEEDDDAADGPSAPAEPPVPPTPTIPPSSVSIQLLDATEGDGTAAVARVRTLLTDGGFRISAQRSAGRVYEVTTIFYTVGREAEGRLVGQQLGVVEVRPMTDLPPERRLSDTVMVHVVIGNDRR